MKVDELIKLKNQMIFIFLAILSANNVLADNTAIATESKFNAALAEQLGADDYGMRSYVMVILNTGPNDARITDKEKRAELFKGHFSNMSRLAEEGKLVLAGPFVEGKPKRGLLIFNVKAIEDAEALIKTDPAVEAGIFVYDMTKFYGSAALMQVGKIHKTIQKNTIE